MRDTGPTPVAKPLRITKLLRQLVALFCICVVTFSLFADAIGLGGTPGFGRTQIVLFLSSSILLAVVAADKKGHISAKIALTLVAFLICFCGLEFAYRIWLLNRGASYRVCSEVYTEFDEKHGERFKPNIAFWNTFIQDGDVVFGTVISRSNADGLGGRTTIAEYRERDSRVLVFGDSFSHWNQMGSTWPDILESELTRQVEGSVGVLNFARGTYGVTQMLNLAAEKVEQHTPDLVIIAAIGDDFSRARWWRKEFDWNGHTRWLLSSRHDRFLDYPGAVDTTLVNQEANRDWCERMLVGEATEADYGVLDAINRQYSILRQENDRIRGTFNPFSLSRSYLYSRISGGRAYGTPSPIPRVAFDDFSLDRELVANIQSLRNSDCPILLVYLPQKSEIDQAETKMSEQNQNLMRSLERIMNQQFVLLHKETDLEPPEKMDLKPYDGHPNISGLTWYARAVTPFAEAVLKDETAQQIDQKSLAE